MERSSSMKRFQIREGDNVFIYVEEAIMDTAFNLIFPKHGTNTLPKEKKIHKGYSS